MNHQHSHAATATLATRDGFTQANGLPAVPIVLGVVGHRDLRAEDSGILKEKLKEIFRQFREAYPHTPLVVLSGLAEGADQLGAEAALEPGPETGESLAFVRAPLPFAQEMPLSFAEQIYRQSTSFATDDGRNGLDKLLANSQVERFVVPLPRGTAGPTIDWQHVATAREGPDLDLRHTCYANVGGYIARRCHALIALWDGPAGEPSHGPSGTAEHVMFKLQGRAARLYPWRFAEPLGFRGERGLVVVLHARRAKAPPGSPTLAEAAGVVRVFVPNNRDELWPAPPDMLPLARRLGPWPRFWSRVKASLAVHPGRHGPDADAPKGRTWEKERRRQIGTELRQFRQICTTIDHFNRDVARPAVAKAFRAAQAAPHAPHFDAPPHSDWLNRLSRTRAAAGALSRHLQPVLDRAIAAVFGLLGLSALVFHLYAHWPESDAAVRDTALLPLLLVISTFLLASAVGVVVGTWWTRLDERRLDSRALAEALRVRRAWAVAGLGESLADSYLGQLRSEVSWVRQALLHSCPPPLTWADQFAGLSPDRQQERLRHVQKEWVQGQIDQFRKAKIRAHQAAGLWRKFGFALAVLGWLSLPVLAWTEASARRWLHPAVLILSSTLVIVGGLCIAYCERQAHEELSKQYERMQIVFTNGDLELAARLKDGDIPGAQDVIKALGREAILEHSQWLVLRRSRPLELHIGG